MTTIGTFIKKHLTAVLFFCLTTLVYGQNITIYTIGDSTMANKPDTEQNPERGWAQMLPEIFNKDITIVNKAVNGRSTRSFINEGRWEEVYQMLQPGDYVFIQFGHNDQKVKSPDRYTNPHTAYRHHLIKFVNQTRDKEAIPILFSSIVRRNFNDQGTLIDTHGAYPLETRLVAQQYGVDFIDLQYLTEVLEMRYGVEKSKELHLHYSEGEIPYYPKGKKDDTHLSVKGAREVCNLVAQQLKAAKHPLSNYLIQ